MATSFGRYKIIEELGAGGMATVYRAHDPRFNREVAIKVMSGDFAHNPTFARRFEREAQTVAGLEHPAIVQVYDFGEHEGRPFLVMRYMSGGSLAHRIKRGPLPNEQIAVILDRIAEGLDWAHSLGIIHRDIKPANILFDQHDYPYLADFGIVKLTESATLLTGSGIVGTPAYMAPEMMNKGGLTYLIDIYALTVTLYQMLTGRQPFEADTPLGLLMAHANKPVPDLQQVRPDLPHSIQAVIEGGMAKDPMERYQSAGLLAEGFHDALRGGTQPAIRHIAMPDSPLPTPKPITSSAGPDIPTMDIGEGTASPPAGVVAPPEPAPVPRSKRRSSAPWAWIGGIGAVVVIGIIGLVALLGSGTAPRPAEEPIQTEVIAAESEEVAEEEPPAEEETAGEPIKVGLSFSDFATNRWKNEEVLMRGLLEDLGYEVLSQEANHDVRLQNDQIDNMVGQGVKALIVIAEDGDAVVTSVDKAADAGVLVIAYDRLIKTTKIAAYMSFNNVEVGRQQAMGVMDALDIENWNVNAYGPARVVKLGGSPTDNNAILFRLGQDEILDPLEAEGKIEIVADQWVDNWDAANALKLMENILTAQSNDIDAVVASNDGTALGALQAMKAQGLAGVVPISGQDATANGCNSIVKGELTVTILKDIRDLSPLAVDLIDKLLKGEGAGLEMYSLAELTYDDSKVGQVPCYFLPVFQVNASNVYELVVASGFQSYDDVYDDIPEEDRPPRP